MTSGEDLGRTICSALWACLGFMLGGILGVFLFAAVDLNFRIVPSEPPFQWVEPMYWTSLACAIGGAGLGAFVAPRHSRKQVKR